MRRAGSLLIIVALILMPAPGLRAQDASELTTRLAALGRIWGLAKYFHPDVTGTSRRSICPAAFARSIPVLASSILTARRRSASASCLMS